MNWTQQEAIDLCVKVEAICPKFGCHVALTGGLLYKTGPRKDCDLVFYRIRQRPEIDNQKMIEALQQIGFGVFKGFGFVLKTDYQGKSVDCMFPEEIGGTYDPDHDGTHEDSPPHDMQSGFRDVDTEPDDLSETIFPEPFDPTPEIPNSAS
jgi:hypothetical protein